MAANMTSPSHMFRAMSFNLPDAIILVVLSFLSLFYSIGVMVCSTVCMPMSTNVNEVMSEEPRLVDQLYKDDEGLFEKANKQNEEIEDEVSVTFLILSVIQLHLILSLFYTATNQMNYSVLRRSCVIIPL